MSSYGYWYRGLLARLLRAKAEGNERTGTRVKVLHGAEALALDLENGLLPVPGVRKVFPRSAAAEVAWFMQGTQDASFIRQYAPLWDKFVEPLTDRHSELEGVKAAYGYRWRKHFGRDQIALAVEALRRDPSDRRVFVSAWDPAEDGLGRGGQLNVPCPTSFTLHIVGGRLHSAMFLRSSDVFVGLPYDIMGHALLMDAIATELDIRPGIAHFTMAHAHLYESHWRLTEEALQQDVVDSRVPMPGWSLTAIEHRPHEYVELVAVAAKHAEWPSFSPRPEVVA